VFSIFVFSPFLSLLLMCKCCHLFVAVYCSVLFTSRVNSSDCQLFGCAVVVLFVCGVCISRQTDMNMRKYLQFDKHYTGIYYTYTLSVHALHWHIHVQYIRDYIKTFILYKRNTTYSMYIPTSTHTCVIPCTVRCTAYSMYIYILYKCIVNFLHAVHCIFWLGEMFKKEKVAYAVNILLEIEDKSFWKILHLM